MTYYLKYIHFYNNIIRYTNKKNIVYYLAKAISQAN